MQKIQENVPLSPLTTFGIGGSARYFTSVRSEDELRDALLWAKGKTLPYVILAGGSNVLVPDQGLEALVIHIESSKSNIQGTMVEAEAGSPLLDLIQKTALLGLGGWAKLSGIPGTLGGAIRGNAGAFGSEIKDFVTSVEAFNAHTFEIREFPNLKCEFAYRASFFKKNPEWIIMSARLTLQKGDAKEFLKEGDATIAERERRHIQNVRAAGSYFMNPIVPQEVRELFEKEKGVKSREGRVPAGWLIEKAGMKGVCEGGAEASEQHPNYLVNKDGATAEDVKKLATKIKDAVNVQFGVTLREEAVIL
jgi:UDP-N-acetylmuramate dehydrogenase